MNLRSEDMLISRTLLKTAYDKSMATKYCVVVINGIMINSLKILCNSCVYK